jgi:hypothetical protein
MNPDPQHWFAHIRVWQVVIPPPKKKKISNKFIKQQGNFHSSKKI